MYSSPDNEWVCRKSGAVLAREMHWSFVGSPSPREGLRLLKMTAIRMVAHIKVVRTVVCIGSPLIGGGVIALREDLGPKRESKTGGLDCDLLDCDVGTRLFAAIERLAVQVALWMVHLPAHRRSHPAVGESHLPHQTDTTCQSQTNSDTKQSHLWRSESSVDSHE